MVTGRFFMVLGQILWLFMVPGGFFMAPGRYFMVRGQFFMVRGRFFMVLGQILWLFMVPGVFLWFQVFFMVFHGHRSVCLGSKLVFSF